MSRVQILDELKARTCETMKKDGMDLSILLQRTSSAIRENNKTGVQETLIQLIEHNLIIAKQYDINMEVAWRKWATKARAKKYYSD